MILIHTVLPMVFFASVVIVGLWLLIEILVGGGDDGGDHRGDGR